MILSQFDTEALYLTNGDIKAVKDQLLSVLTAAKVSCVLQKLHSADRKPGSFFYDNSMGYIRPFEEPRGFSKI